MKKLTRILALVLSLAMVVVLASCDSLKGTDETTVTTALAGTVPIDKGAIKVGVLHITSIEDTSGYTFAHHSGIMEMKESLGLKDEQVIEKDNVSDTDIPATKAAIQDLINAGCNIIFATSFNYMNTMEEFANNPDYQDIIFSHCSGYKSNNVNFNNYFGRIYEARYLAGIAAGLKAKQLNKPLLGYVAAMDVTMSEVTGGIDAWALGIQSVYPEAKVKVKVTGSWYNPEAEKAAAQALIDAGCVVIGQHCDSDVTQTTAQDNGVFGCGYNSDMTPFAPKGHICAPIWNWGVYYTAAVQAAIDGTWKPVNYYEGMNKGLVDISPINEDVAAPGTKEAVEAAKAKIASGELFVFTGPLYDNTGKLVLAAGEKLTDAQITGGMTYYIKGVDLL
ncbi:MAG TPA: BMP family ABC transporter substrate-binding protein [Clostridiales bacterium]|nr:MAG: Purine-binding protein precursor [Firmicutes bacterium ADurb.Bin262]HOU10701.1 BMP family ABC transporter substrate-binding protein [Clostridiales bacterium]HQK73643.1 BMP family ABC transporter substrate-binding protein [Clostridiales bacterium]